MDSTYKDNNVELTGEYKRLTQQFQDLQEKSPQGAVSGRAGGSSDALRCPCGSIDPVRGTLSLFESVRQCVTLPLRSPAMPRGSILE